MLADPAGVNLVGGLGLKASWTVDWELGLKSGNGLGYAVVARGGVGWFANEDIRCVGLCDWLIPLTAGGRIPRIQVRSDKTLR